MNKHLPALLAAALALPALAAPPQVKIQSFTAKYCPKPSPDTGCSEFIVSRPVFPDAAQNAFVEKLLRPMSAADGLKTLTKAAALRELKKRVNKFRDDEGYPRHQYIVEADLEGYTPHYSQTKQKISNKACSKDKQPDITFLRCRLIFAHTFSIGFNSGEYGGSGRMICPALCAISRSTAIL